MKELDYTSLDDRKELFNILKNYMTEQEREAFLLWCCNKCDIPLNKVLRPGKNSTYHEKEVYFQLYCLAFMHGANLDKIMQAATHFARRTSLDSFEYNIK